MRERNDIYQQNQAHESQPDSEKCLRKPWKREATLERRSVAITCKAAHEDGRERVMEQRPMVSEDHAGRRDSTDQRLLKQRAKHGGGCNAREPLNGDLDRCSDLEGDRLSPVDGTKKSPHTH